MWRGFLIGLCLLLLNRCPSSLVFIIALVAALNGCENNLYVLYLLSAHVPLYSRTRTGVQTPSPCSNTNESLTLRATATSSRRTSPTTCRAKRSRAETERRGETQSERGEGEETRQTDCSCPQDQAETIQLRAGDFSHSGEI